MSECGWAVMTDGDVFASLEEEDVEICLLVAGAQPAGCVTPVFESEADARSFMACCKARGDRCRLVNVVVREVPG